MARRCTAGHAPRVRTARGLLPDSGLSGTTVSEQPWLYNLYTHGSSEAVQSSEDVIQ